MSDIKINSEKQLVRFLRTVAQESYKKSLNESYMDYDDIYKFDVDRFGPLNKYDKKESVAEEEEMPPEEAERDLVEPDERDPDAPEKAIKDKEDAMTTVSFDSVISRINRIRAGRSLKDKETKLSLEDYYNKLDENERIVLKIFLEEISEILGGEISGANAKDPSDPPESFKITSAEEDADKEAEKDVKSAEPAAGDLFGSPGEEEDTTPPKEDEDLPVAVNERKSDWELRMKIRELMER